MRSLGIDEAGRGCAVGPMVICGVIRDDTIHQPQLLSAKDSKKYKKGQAWREELHSLATLIHQEAKVITITIPAWEIVDLQNKGRNLNLIEQKAAYSIIKAAGEIDRCICDGSFFSRVSEWTENVIAEDKADSKYREVSAASICAKSIREEVISTLMPGFKGGGYPNEHTWKWVLEDYSRTGVLSSHVRTTWSWFTKHEAKLKTPFIRETGERKWLTT